MSELGWTVGLMVLLVEEVGVLFGEKGRVHSSSCAAEERFDQLRGNGD